MVRIPILFCAVFCLSFGLTHAQDSIECQTKLSNFHEDVKAQRYDKAYDNWYFVKTNCPELSLAIYSDGEKILKHKIDNSEGETQLGFVNDLLGLWKDRRQYFENRTPIGEFGASACQLRYDYREELGEELSDLYNCFDDAFKSDKENFTHPKSLYAYFSLLVEMYRKDQKQATELFNTYDEINEKIGLEIQNYSELLNALVHKIDNGETLSSKEIKKRSAYESYLKNYALINSNIETIINTEGNC
ncbi:hypothetical protein [Winogradskyella tangerina]|uniref:hypothetical protein n=1 Tax=Winogradskyella tangerina TaxID=2023240 RepID=UPI000DBE8BB5|nr:hypothetical protein [Winogradskyella tangerina]